MLQYNSAIRDMIDETEGLQCAYIQHDGRVILDFNTSSHTIRNIMCATMTNWLSNYGTKEVIISNGRVSIHFIDAETRTAAVEELEEAYKDDLYYDYRLISDNILLFEDM